MQDKVDHLLIDDKWFENVAKFKYKNNESKLYPRRN
jgi:hypothetical protein